MYNYTPALLTKLLPQSPKKGPPSLPSLSTLNQVIKQKTLPSSFFLFPGLLSLASLSYLADGGGLCLDFRKVTMECAKLIVLNGDRRHCRCAAGAGQSSIMVFKAGEARFEIAADGVGVGVGRS